MRRFLITGGAKRLGGEIARSLAERGQDLALHYRTSGRAAQELAECLRVDTALVQGDFSSQEGTAHFIAKYRSLNIQTAGLIYNVGPYLQKTLLDTSEAEWRELFETTVHAPLILTRALVKDLIDAQGTVIMIGMAGLGRADPKRAAYKIAKSSLYSITKELAKELAPKGVTVNMISPGYLENSIDMPEKFSPYTSGRLVRCSEICQAVHFCIENRQLTGQNLEVAGGIGL